MLKLNFDAAQLDIPCPGCGQKAKATLGRLQRDGGFTCGGCGNHVGADRDQLARDITATVEAGEQSLAQQLNRSRRR